ncbi:MAG TPA: CoA-binding protein [Bacteroidia bacterium]
MDNQKHKTTLVFGASENPERYSNMAVKMLKSYGHPVIAIGKKEGSIEETPIRKEIPELNAGEINTVSLYLNPTHQEAYYEKIIHLKPERVIFNPGSENEAFQDLLDSNNIAYEEACTLVLLRTGQF